jgi:hypothetical protein
MQVNPELPCLDDGMAEEGCAGGSMEVVSIMDAGLKALREINEAVTALEQEEVAD